jgi:hypothetical protein
MDKNAKSAQTQSKNHGLAIPRKALILLLVRLARLELARHCWQQILRPMGLS